MLECIKYIICYLLYSMYIINDIWYYLIIDLFRFKLVLMF